MGSPSGIYRPYGIAKKLDNFWFYHKAVPMGISVNLRPYYRIEVGLKV